MPETTAKRSWKLLRTVAAALALVVLACFCYSCASEQSMRHEIASESRDPITGVIVGTESVTLLPAMVDESSSRTAVLMIHGFLGSPQDFGQLGQRLASRGLTVRKMRLPGHGTTAADFDYQPDGALYKAVRQEFLSLQRDFDQVVVIGFSMGGALGTLLASREPIERLVVVAPYYGVTYQWYYGLPPETWNTLTGWMFSYIRRPTAFVKINDKSARGKYFMYGTLPMGGVRQLMDLGRQARQDEVLEKVTCPVLHIHSRGDEAASPKAADRAFRAMASDDKRQVWFTRSNHVLFWDYDKEEVIAAVERFLAGEE